MRIKHYSFLLMAFVFSMQFLSAQQETTLPGLSRVYQNSSINPSASPAYSLSIGLPILSNLSFNASVKGIDLDMILSSVDKKDSFFVPRKFFEKVAASKATDFGYTFFYQTDLFHISFPVLKYQVGFFSDVRMFQSLLFPKEIIGLGASGNIPVVGNSIQFSKLNIQFMSFVETGVSVQREFDRFSIGARLKHYNGIANLNTDEINASLSLMPNAYEPVYYNMSGSVNMSGVPIQTSFFDSTFKSKLNPKDTVFDAATYKPFKNNGFGLDLGFTWHFTPRLSAFVSLLDLGYINWKASPYKFKLNDINAVFPGMPLDVLRDSTKSKKYTDSLLNKLQPTFVNESYVTWMPTRMFFGAEYQLTLRDKVGALMQFQFYNKRTFAAYSLSYNRRVGTNWDITSNYSFSAGSYYNLGFGTSVKWGAFQIYMMQDDILWLFLLEKSRNFTFRLGCNLVWGQKPLRKRI